MVGNRCCMYVALQVAHRFLLPKNPGWNVVRSPITDDNNRRASSCIHPQIQQILPPSPETATETGQPTSSVRSPCRDLVRFETEHTRRLSNRSRGRMTSENIHMHGQKSQHVEDDDDGRLWLLRTGEVVHPDDGLGRTTMHGDSFCFGRVVCRVGGGKNYFLEILQK